MNTFADYRQRHKSVNFARHSIDHVKRYLGKVMIVDIAEKSVIDYQTLRLKESAAPKLINEEVGVFVRLLGEPGDVIRMRLRRAKGAETHRSAVSSNGLASQHPAPGLAKGSVVN